MAYVFDGPNKIITFDVSTTFLDVQDLWSRYEDWLEIDDNSKYLLAMRSVGGDPLPGSKQLGITYFLLNGWKIKPYEETHILNVDGNLYSEDGSSPFTPVIGNYNVMVINTVSNLVDSTVQQLPEIEQNSFLGHVTLDVNNGVAGTLYPIGTPTSPVNNLEDAKIIAAYRGFKRINLQSNLTITTGQNINELHFVSDNWIEITIEPGVATQNTNFEKLSVYGEFDGFWNVLEDCWVYDITNFCGWLRGGSFVNVSLAPYTVESNGQSFFDEVVPMFPDEYSTIICNTDTAVAISSHTGKLDIKSMTDGTIIEIGFRTGKLRVDNSNIGGILKLRGVCELENTSTGVTIDDGSLNVDTIANANWDEMTSEHQIVGSTGKALTSAGAAGDPWISELPGTYISGQAGYIMAQIQKLTEELHRIQGLDVNNPMTVTPVLRSAGDIELELSGDGEAITIVTRQ
jgi:hypothetical protein